MLSCRLTLICFGKACRCVQLFRATFLDRPLVGLEIHLSRMPTVVSNIVRLRGIGGGRAALRADRHHTRTAS